MTVPTATSSRQASRLRTRRLACRLARGARRRPRRPGALTSAITGVDAMVHQSGGRGGFGLGRGETRSALVTAAIIVEETEARAYT